MLSAAARESVVGWQRLHQDDRLWVCQGGHKQAHLHLMRHTRLSSTRDHSQQGACACSNAQHVQAMCMSTDSLPVGCCTGHCSLSLVRCLIDQHHQTSSGVSLPNIIKSMHAQQKVKSLMPAHRNEYLTASSSCVLQADINHAS